MSDPKSSVFSLFVPKVFRRFLSGATHDVIPTDNTCAQSRANYCLHNRLPTLVLLLELLKDIRDMQLNYALYR
jgi:hypothetical protein